MSTHVSEDMSGYASGWQSTFLQEFMGLDVIFQNFDVKRQKSEALLDEMSG
jgi:hypothetical protein